MYPELFRIGNFVVSSFGLMVAISFFVGYWVASLEFKRKKIDENLLGNILLLSMVGGIGGAKIMYILENVPINELFRNPLTHLLSRGGLTFYGGFICAIFLVWILTYKNKAGFLRVMDATSPSLALAHAIGRIGCFLVGDDYGVQSDLPWAMAFPKGLPPTNENVHPTQIYEIVLMSIVFIVLWKFRKKNKPDGWLFSVFLILAGTERLLIEFIRNTTPSPVPGLSVAQLIAIVLIIAGTIKILSLRSRNQ